MQGRTCRTAVTAVGTAGPPRTVQIAQGRFVPSRRMLRVPRSTETEAEEAAAAAEAGVFNEQFRAALRDSLMRSGPESLFEGGKKLEPK